MVRAISNLLNETAPDLKRRLVTVYGVLAVMNAGAWIWALAAFHGNPDMLGVSLAIYGLGLRHAVDADHIAAIDNVTRKLIQEGRRPVAVGFFFAMGHSAVVIAAAAAVAAAATLLGRFEAFRSVSGLIGTAVSSLFLLGIAAMNTVIFVSVYRSYRRVRAGGVWVAENLDLMFGNRGFLARLLRPIFRMVGHSWHMFPIGILFGLGFDTATEVATFGIAAAEAAKGISLGAVLVFPILFAAAMSLVDTTDGVIMLGAYNWAFVKPSRKLYYNMTITVVSIVVAVLIGGIEALGLISDRLALRSGFWDGVGALNDNLNVLGLVVLATFALAWTIFYAIHKSKGLETREEQIASA